MKKILIYLNLVSMLAVAAHAQPLVLSLAEAVTLAEEHAHAAAVSASMVDEAAARRHQARAGHLPTVSVTQEVIRTDDAVAAFGTRLRQERFTAQDLDLERLNRPDALTGVRTVLEVNQPLFTSGSSLYKRRAAHAGEAASVAMARRTSEEIRLQAATAYWGLVLAAEARDVAEAALSAARQHAMDAEVGWQVGTVSRSDRLATELRVAELESDDIDAEAGILRAADALTLILGCDTEVVVTTADSLAINVSPPPLAAGAIRSDLLALGWQQQAAEHQARVERAASLPQVGAFARVAADGRSLFGADGTSWMAGAVLRWDLFSGFAARGSVEAARARVHRSEAEQRWLTARIVREIREAERTLAAAAKRVEVADAAVRHADEQLRIVRAESDQGVSSVSSRLDAEAAWRGANLRHLQALYDLRLGEAHLLFATGSRPAAEPNK